MRVRAGTHIHAKINTVCSCYYYGRQPGTLCVWVSAHVTFMFGKDYCCVMVPPVRTLDTCVFVTVFSFFTFFFFAV